MVSALFHSGGIIPSAIVSAIASALFHSEGIIPVNLSWGIETALCGENELQIAQNLAWRSRCAQRE
jgi:hypothetical protein